MVSLQGQERVGWKKKLTLDVHHHHHRHHHKNQSKQKQDKTSTSYSSRSSSSSSSSASSSSRKTYRIGFCEPYTTEEISKNGFFSMMFTVDKNMYNTLLKTPRMYYGKRNEDKGNAYIFGRVYKPHEYVKIGTMGNDGAQVGFVDVDLMKRADPQMMKEISELVLEEYFGKNGQMKMKHWSDRKAFARVHKKFPHILFLGDTVGGDVGADLYAHYDKHKRIDSLLIENDYFFPVADNDDE